MKSLIEGANMDDMDYRYDTQCKMQPKLSNDTELEQNQYKTVVPIPLLVYDYDHFARKKRMII